MLRLAAAILLVLLAACGELVDAGEARLCRLTLPALNVNARLSVEQTRSGPYPASLRIDYRAIRAEGQVQQRFVICRFSAERGARNLRDLIGLATETGPMANASFYFLKRFYLEAPDAAPVDPAPPDARATLPEVPLWLAYGSQQLLVALPTAAVYALLAAAYALIYGLVGRIVLVFGEFAALASLAGVVGLGLFFAVGVETAISGVIIALVIGVASAALHGFALSRVALTGLARASGQQVLIATVGVGIVLTEYLRLAQGADMRWLPPIFNQPLPLMRSGDFVTTMTAVSGLAAMTGLATMLALLVFMAHSPYGRQWRAVSDDPQMAALLGVDERKVHDRALIIACAVAGLGGIIVTVLYGGMGFAGGFSIGLKALIAAILGGIGSIGGAALGGLAVAAFEAIWSSTMPIELRDLVIYSALVIVLVIRPGGFFGYADLGPRRV
ncbi:MAG: branched-chain amino acid ABC transporter permease [Bosea sp. (in: a-proteobacteria)]